MEGERAAAQTKNEALTPRQIANRTKVEHLLSPLKSSAIRRLNFQTEEEMLKKEIADLKRQVARERLKNKRLKLFGLLEILQLVVLLFLLTFFLLLVSGSL